MADGVLSHIYNGLKDQEAKEKLQWVKKKKKKKTLTNKNNKNDGNKIPDA